MPKPPPPPPIEEADIVVSMNKKKQWILVKEIGRGTFGALWLGREITDAKKMKVAIKIEDKKAVKQPQLKLEWYFYQKLGQKAGIPTIHGLTETFKNGRYDCLIMELLGRSLKAIKMSIGHKMSLRSSLLIAIKVINILEYVHNKGIIHRDIKPDNFVFGSKEAGKQHQLYIIDFGLAKEWRENGSHIQQERAKYAMGTPKYMSIQAHELKGQSRKDDLESVAYMILDFLNGKLPWDNMSWERDPDDGKIPMNERKKSLKTKMFDGNPECFARYYRNVRGLKFDEDPDYDLYRNLFLNELKSHGWSLENVFEWDNDDGTDSDTRDIYNQSGSNAKIRGSYSGSNSPYSSGASSD